MFSLSFLRIISFFVHKGDVMYEPKNLPHLSVTALLPSKLRYGISYCNQYGLEKDKRPTSNYEADPLHVHEYLEIFFNLSSDVSFLVNNRLFFVKAGQAVFTRPNDIHMAVFHQSTMREHICLWIDADLSSPLFDFLRKENFSPLFSFDEKDEQQLKMLLFSLQKASLGDLSPLEATACLLRILTFFEKNDGQAIKESAMPAPLRKILDDINKNLPNIHSVNDILRTHFISPATLTRWFRKYMHSSPHEYLESLRLSLAATMLSNGATVTGACMASGFSDCSHFIVLFKKKFGLTPLKYKNRTYMNDSK